MTPYWEKKNFLLTFSFSFSYIWLRSAYSLNLLIQTREISRGVNCYRIKTSVCLLLQKQHNLFLEIFEMKTWLCFITLSVCLTTPPTSVCCASMLKHQLTQVENPVLIVYLSFKLFYNYFLTCFVSLIIVFIGFW